MSSQMFSVLISIFGMFVLLLIGFLFSRHKKAINYRTVGLSFLLQVLFGGFVLYVPIGQKILAALSSGFVKILSYARAGSSFLFGNLLDFDKFDYIFAIDVLPVIIYFSALVSLLYYYGVMTFIIKSIGGFLRFVLRASRTETTAAAAAIFVGNPELTVRPYLRTMTTSQLFVVMVAAMASISGEVVAGYVGMGIPAPIIIAASLMTAPGCLLFAKLIIPETEEIKTDKDVKLTLDYNSNALEAISRGAADGAFIAINVAAMLLAFLSLIALINGILGLFYDDLTLQFILGKILKYLCVAMGVPLQDSEIAGQMIGLKTITNEFVAYSDFTKTYVVAENGVFQNFQGIQDVTGVIICFALCGYANLGSIAVYLGSISYLAPSRRSDIARFGWASVLASSLSNLMSAVIAGFYFYLGNGELMNHLSLAV